MGPQKNTKRPMTASRRIATSALKFVREKRGLTLPTHIARKKLVLTLPTHMARKDMHEILRRGFSTINTVENIFIKHKFEENFVRETIAQMSAPSVHNFDKRSRDDGSRQKYNYIVAGPSSWNEHYKDKMSMLTEYELSALKRISYNIFYFPDSPEKLAILLEHHRNQYDKIKEKIEKFGEFKKLRSKLINNSTLSESEKDEMIKEKDRLENSKNIFIDIEKDLKDSIPKNSGVAFYLNDIDKNIPPSDQNIFRPMKKFSIELVIFKENNDIPENEKTIIPKPKGLFSDVKQISKQSPKKSVRAVSAKPVKVKPSKEELQKQAEARAEQAAQAAQAARSARAEARTARTARTGGSVVNIGQDIGKVLFKKCIFTINICNYDQSFDSMKIDNLTVESIEMSTNGSLRYLNEVGLSILHEQQLKNLFILASAYNTSAIREKIYKKISLDSKTPAEQQQLLLKTAWVYYNVFFNSPYYNEKVFVSLLDKYLKTTSIGNVVKDLEVEIIEKIRPYINACIININTQLQAISEFENNIGIFVVGGDSIRRYKNDVTKTDDIDTKIHIPSKYQNPNDLKKIIYIVLENLFNLCAYFIVFKESILEYQKKEVTYTDSTIDGDLYFNGFTYTLEFELYNKDQNIDDTNFKFRQTFKDTFPVDLLSLDYNCRAFIRIKRPGKSNDIVVPFKFEISFLDVVIEMISDNPSYYKTYSILSNDLPVCSLDFLIQDLTKTYNSVKQSSARFLSGKNIKDHTRYDTLIKIKNMDDDIKPFHYKFGSPTRILVDNQKLRNYEQLQKDRAQLDRYIKFPTADDETKPEFENYEEFVNFFKTYYDTVKISRNKVMTTYDITSMKEKMKKIEEEEASSKRAKTTKGGRMDLMKSFKDTKNDITTQIERSMKAMKQFTEKSQQSEELKQEPAHEFNEDNSLLFNKLLRSLVTANNLTASYAFDINIEEYDDLFIEAELELLKYAEYIITDNNIVANENVNKGQIIKYKAEFYKIIHDFFKSNEVTSVPHFNRGKDFYEIDWTGNVITTRQLHQLQKYIDDYGGCSLYYEQ